MKFGLSVVLTFVVLSGLLCLGCSRARSPNHTEYEDYSRTADDKPICPKCSRSDKIFQYVYGKDAQCGSGQVGAGCCVGPDSADYLCDHCTTNFGITELAYTVGGRKR